MEAIMRLRSVFNGSKVKIEALEKQVSDKDVEIEMLTEANQDLQGIVDAVVDFANEVAPHEEEPHEVEHGA